MRRGKGSGPSSRTSSAIVVVIILGVIHGVDDIHIMLGTVVVVVVVNVAVTLLIERREVFSVAVVAVGIKGAVIAFKIVCLRLVVAFRLHG